MDCHGSLRCESNSDSDPDFLIFAGERGLLWDDLKVRRTMIQRATARRNCWKRVKTMLGSPPGPGKCSIGRWHHFPTGLNSDCKTLSDSAHEFVGRELTAP
jgi:hypothetical protein